LSFLSVSEESHFFSLNQKRAPSDLSPQDDGERLKWCHSVAGEESHTSIEFLAQKHYYL
jgi:hypothetical protein